MKLSELKIENLTLQNDPTLQQGGDKDAIAIIGMSGQVGSAKDLQTFWEGVVKNKTFQHPIGLKRREDLDRYLTAKNCAHFFEETDITSGSMMDDISEFDPLFFNISKQEAMYMDPQQRLFMKMAWEALEDAGYASEGIKGTKTGVFVGVATNFGEAYTNLIKTFDPDAPEISVVGNMQAAIPGRLSHFLDIHGPSLLIDTACSSGLTTIYTAMRSLQNNDCEMAIVGGVKCEILPVNDHHKQGIGIGELGDIGSSDGLTRTFDQSSDGTGTAEGGVVFILKPLHKALADNDNIASVILGGAMNHDGDSNGLTAPNPDAQTALILDAINDANVDAEKISYIEAHGTATKLGDPIEIKGITNAFKQLTDKKQYISIGSVKSNVGHMDNVSGLIGVAKLAKSMQHNVLPASLHFFEPNQNIDFINAPVYVNAKTTSWFKEGETVYAGINSFGLSGTNCHLILQSFPKNGQKEVADGYGLFTLSHKSRAGLYELARNHLAFIQKNAVDVHDCAYTTYVGRRHLEVRLAIVFKNKEELCNKLRQFIFSTGSEEDYIFVGEHKVSINAPKKEHKVHYLTPMALAQMNEQIKADVKELIHEDQEGLLINLARKYISGGKIPVEAITEKSDIKKVALPTYHFLNESYWVKGEQPAKCSNKTLLSHSKVVKTKEFTILYDDIAARDYWELYEHKINNAYVIPGTAYINAVLNGFLSDSGHDLPLKISNVVFPTPFYLKEDEQKELQLMISHEDEEKQFTVISSIDDNWSEHASGVIQNGINFEKKHVNLSQLKKELPLPIVFDDNHEEGKGLYLGKHWKNLVITGDKNETEDCFLIELKFKNKEADNRQAYPFHPSLTDTAINAVNSFLTGDKLYLPLSYGELIMHEAINDHLFVHMRKTKSDAKAKIVCFDMTIYGKEGNELATINNYVAKEMEPSKFNEEKAQKPYGYTTVWQRYDQKPSVVATQESILCIYGDEQSKKRINELRHYFDISHIEELDLRHLDAKELILPERKKPISSIIYAYSPLEVPETYDSDYSAKIQQRLKESYELLRGIIMAKYIPQNELILLTQRTKRNGITAPVPDYAAVSGLWKVAAKEYESYKIRLVEYDDNTNDQVLAAEVLSSARPRHLIYQGNMSFTETIEAIKPSLKTEVSTSESLSDSQTDGVYILTGGTGALGLVTAEMLVKKGVKNLVFLTRGAFPPAHEWRDAIDTGNDLLVVEKLKKLCKLHDALEHLEIINVDLCDYQNLKRVMARLFDKYSKIQGIIHLAGIAGDGYLLNKEWSTFIDVFKAKAIPFLNLHYALASYHVEYLVAFSSMSSIVVEEGQSDYTAANLFLDEWTKYRRQENLNGFSIQWPAWREVGMAKRLNAVNENDYFQPLNTEEALGLLDDIMFSKSDYPAVLVPGKKQEIKKTSVKKQIKSSRKNVKITGIEAPDRYIKDVAHIWSDVLILDEVDIYDEFSALGGSSLFVSKMLSEYEKYAPGAMDIASLFTYTTIAGQAEQLRMFYEEKSENNNEHIDEDVDLDTILNGLVSGEIDLEASAKLIK
ncbi:MAG: KR domain-containing protein [Defluviitaleaceae bacterium]|nr:KR domain-containing protein [Defluviitaleaceae bacterium]